MCPGLLHREIFVPFVEFAEFTSLGDRVSTVLTKNMFHVIKQVGTVIVS